MLVTNGGDSLDRLNDTGIKYEIFKSLKSRNPISFASNLKNLRDISKEKDADIIHTYHRYSELLAVQASRLIRNRKFRTVFTSLSMVNKKYRVEFKSDKIIAVSNAVKKMLTEKFNINSEHISVIHNFADTEEIHELEAFHGSVKDHGKHFNILAIGRFHHEKNFEVLLKAMNILKDDKLKLILIGEGDNDINYLKYISQHKLNVELVVPQKNLLEYFMVADMCVLPSSKDPFPNFMLQSGLHKKPFIGANVDGIGELIKDGHNGLLFESGNETELAEKIHHLRMDENFARHCANNLYNDVINHYTQEFIIPKIEKLYRAVLKE